VRLGISYNIFDGTELLEPSINCVRTAATFISIIYQTVSNHGWADDEKLENLILDLNERGLIDYFKIFYPQPGRSPSENEVSKRNLGLWASRENGCTHHLSMDCDEFYYKDEFAHAIFEIEREGYDVTACQMQSYYKRPDLRVNPPEDYWVTFVTKIYEYSEFVLNGPFPELVDPTRRMNEGNIYCPAIFHNFPRPQLQMHHMSYVRNNIRKKLENSSALDNFRDHLDQVIDHWENFKEGDRALFAGCPPMYHDLVKTRTNFSIDI